MQDSESTMKYTFPSLPQNTRGKLELLDKSVCSLIMSTLRLELAYSYVYNCCSLFGLKQWPRHP